MFHEKQLLKDCPIRVTLKSNWKMYLFRFDFFAGLERKIILIIYEGLVLATYLNPCFLVIEQSGLNCTINIYSRGLHPQQELCFPFFHICIFDDFLWPLHMFVTLSNMRNLYIHLFCRLEQISRKFSFSFNRGIFLYIKHIITNAIYRDFVTLFYENKLV